MGEQEYNDILQGDLYQTAIAKTFPLHNAEQSIIEHKILMITRQIFFISTEEFNFVFMKNKIYYKDI